MRFEQPGMSQKLQTFSEFKQFNCWHVFKILGILPFNCSCTVILYRCYYSSCSFVRHCYHHLLPSLQIDHIFGIRFTHRWGNLDLQWYREHRKPCICRAAYEFPSPCVSHRSFQACLFLWHAWQRRNNPWLLWRNPISGYHLIYL